MKTTYLCLLAAITTISAHAGSDSKEMTPVTAPSTAPAGVVFTGISGRASSWYTYVGTVYALNNNLNTSGWLLRADEGGGQYSYLTPAVQGRVRGSIFDSSAGVGYEYADKDWNLSGFVGPHFRDKMLNVSIPSDNSVDRVGAKFNLDFNAQTDCVHWNVLGEYSTIVNSTWDRARVGYQFDVMKLQVGPEFTYNRNDAFDEYRAGAFVTFQLNDFMGLSLSTGYASYESIHGGVGSNDSAYGDFGLSFLY